MSATSGEVQPLSATAPGAPVNLAADAPSRAEVMGHAGSENFPVASYLLGRRHRAQLLTIYGFARLVDDLGDEASGDRLALLDLLERDLDRIYGGEQPDHPVMRALAPTVADCALPDHPFRRLIDANRRDQVVSRYRTFDELLAYCQLSAAPVGELVLHVFGAASPERIELSDRICAALQVVEHLQDVAEDFTRGRIYLPLEDMERFGCEEARLAAATAPQPLRELLAFETERARDLLDGGAPLVRTLPLRPRLAVAGFVAGGRSALDALERAGFDVLGRRPRATHLAFARRWPQAAVGR
jgi:squalene synthase HpnC